MIETILAVIWNYATSIWTTLRIAFGVFDEETMIACAQLLVVVFMIGVIDSLPDLFKRKKKDDEDE